MDINEILVCMLHHSGVAERMMHAFQSLFGGMRGGLAVTVVAIGIILAASAGIIGASVVLLTVMSLPLMMRQGPPVGFSLFYMKSAAPPQVKITELYRGVWPFVVIQLIVIALVVAFEDLVILLPAQVYG